MKNSSEFDPSFEQEVRELRRDFDLLRSLARAVIVLGVLTLLAIAVVGMAP